MCVGVHMCGWVYVFVWYVGSMYVFKCCVCVWGGWGCVGVGMWGGCKGVMFCYHPYPTLCNFAILLLLSLSGFTIRSLTWQTLEQRPETVL